jgi:hypothetical protein
MAVLPQDALNPHGGIRYLRPCPLLGRELADPFERLV